MKYDYTAEQQGDVKVLKGSAYAGKVPFELKVTKRTVTGRFNGRPVTFDVKDVKPIASKAAAAAGKATPAARGCPAPRPPRTGC